jgi:sulfur carrier protein
MRIQVNGEFREAKAGTTVADLLCELDIKSDRVAVEVNLEILDKGVFAQRSLQEGDRRGSQEPSAIGFPLKTAVGFSKAES